MPIFFPAATNYCICGGDLYIISPKDSVYLRVLCIKCKERFQLIDNQLIAYLYPCGVESEAEIEQGKLDEQFPGMPYEYSERFFLPRHR
jgi:hypothetical protein